MLTIRPPEPKNEPSLSLNPLSPTNASSMEALKGCPMPMLVGWEASSNAVSNEPMAFSMQLGLALESQDETPAKTNGKG